MLAVAAALLAGCSNGGADAPLPTDEAAPSTERTTTTTTAPERPVSTTTTAFDPASVEGQVEAAYLRSWDVYAEAVYNLELDENGLAEVYAEALLCCRRRDRAPNRRATGVAEFSSNIDYEIVAAGARQPLILDHLCEPSGPDRPRTK